MQQTYHNGTVPHQISPSQRGYRDGWQAGANAVIAMANGPYIAGTWAYREWVNAFRTATREYRDRYKKQ